MRKIKVMKPEEDAYGQEIWAYYQGRDSCEIVERDDGYFDASEQFPRNYFSEYEDWGTPEKRLWNL